MSKISSRNTYPELAFRYALSYNGLRGYRLHTKLPGHPDIYFPRKKLAVFIDGCFWHKCPECFVKPKSNLKYWNPKLKKNIQRDKKNIQLLNQEQILVTRFWEHEIKEDLEGCFNKFSEIYEKRS